MKLNEATTQGELYRRLRDLGYRAVCEAQIEAPEEASRKKCLRPDVTVLGEDGEILALVEVKSYAEPKYHTGPFTDPEECPTSQLRNYALTGHPVFLCRAWDDLDEVIHLLLRSCRTCL